MSEWIESNHIRPILLLPLLIKISLQEIFCDKLNSLLEIIKIMLAWPAIYLFRSCITISCETRLKIISSINYQNCSNIQRFGNRYVSIQRVSYPAGFFLPWHSLVVRRTIYISRVNTLRNTCAYVNLFICLGRRIGKHLSMI